jgi:YoeB-like toxin of bacterial type II toxin-antitoxin system
MRLCFTPSAWDDSLWFQEHDHKLLKRINGLIQDILVDSKTNSSKETTAMSVIQKVFAAVLPRRWVEALEADSRLWMVRCSCGFARSVWELGGIRYKATGRQLWFMRCSQCGQRSWHKVSRDPPPSQPHEP